MLPRQRAIDAQTPPAVGRYGVKGENALGIKVAKFGGSSLCDAEHFKKVRQIIQSDPDYCYVVPSAPGKRFDEDAKITDMLYQCHSLVERNRSHEELFQKIAERYLAIAEELQLDFDFSGLLYETCDAIRRYKNPDFAASRGEYLNGMLLVFEPGRVRAVATDGHRLAHCSTEADGISERHEVIVPRKTVLEMQRLLEDSDEPVSIDVAPGQIRFRFGDVELVSKLVEGKFPDFTRVIPTNYTRHFLVGREALQGSLQRAAILTTDKFKGVRLQLAQNQMKISSSNAEQEEAQEEIDIDYGHEPLDVGFNVGYLLDVLSNVKVDNIQWSVMPDANASALITLPEDDQFKYVVMPMRI